MRKRGSRDRFLLFDRNGKRTVPGHGHGLGDGLKRLPSSSSTDPLPLRYRSAVKMVSLWWCLGLPVLLVLSRLARVLPIWLDHLRLLGSVPSLFKLIDTS